MNDYYPRLICKIDKVCIRLRIIIAFKTTITIPVLKSLFLVGKLAPPLYLFLHFYPANPPPPSREWVVKRPKLAPPAPGRIPPSPGSPSHGKKKRPGVTLLALSTTLFQENFLQVMNISQQRLWDYHFKTKGKTQCALSFS